MGNLKCLVHPNDRVEFLDGIEQMDNTYCFGFGEEHDIVLETDEYCWYRSKHFHSLQEAFTFRAVYNCNGEALKYVQQQMDAEGTLHEYKFFRLYEVGAMPA